MIYLRTKTNLITVLLFFLLFSISALAKAPPPGTGKADVKANILLMLDNSGSMGWTSSNPNKTYYPVDVGVDSSGNVYSVEYHNHRILKYNSTGTIIKRIGSYGTGNNNFRYPTKIAVDSNDNIFVLDNYNKRIVSYNSSGNFRCTGKIGGSHYPRIYDDIDVDSTGRVYVSTDYEQSVFYFTNNCNPDRQTYVRYGTNGPRFTGKIWLGNNGWPGPMAINENDEPILKFRSGPTLSKYPNDRKNGYIWFKNVTAGFTGGTYSTVTDIEADQNNNILVSAFQHNKIYCYNSSLSLTGSFGGYGTSSTQWRYNYGFAVRGTDVYIADYYGNRILKLDGSNCKGTNLASFGQSDNRMTIAKRVIKKIVSNSDLTAGANFGLMEWGSSYRTKIRVKISDQGAKQIFSDIDNVTPGGGTYLGQAMQKAYNYYKGSDSPINKNANCQNNFTIVISDGDWFGSPNPNSVAANMLKGDGIKTFVIGFQGYNNKANYTNLAKAGGTKNPLFADDEAALLQKLTDTIKQVLASKLTFTSPAIMPDVKHGDNIFQALFNYKANTQWEGRLIKYALQQNGQIGNKIWDAGEKLDSKKESSRKIWTVGPNYPSGTNNFIKSNLSYIKGDLYYAANPDTDANANKIIDFVRGIDVFDENLNGKTNDERWKLGDIYHSQIAIVGPPSAHSTSTNTYTESYYRQSNQYDNFKQTNKNRKTFILAGANDGMLHAFDSLTGDEIWAFIPPSVIPNLRNMVSSKANSSNSIYAVDGSPVVKDIYYDNKWRTVVIAGLGRGGHSYFALDITDIDNPKHLFTFDNDPSLKIIQYWNSDGLKDRFAYNSSIPSEYDFSKLGEAWSTPRILRIRINSNDKWVAVFGAGFNNGVNTNYGNAVFVIDMEDGGKILKKVDVTDKSGNNVVNSVPVSVVPVTADGTSLANYYGAIAYFADYENKLWKLNLTEQGTLYSLQELFDGESTSTNGRRTMHDVTASIDTDNKLWLYYGTGDQQQLQKESSDIKNRLYGLKDVDFPNYNDSATKFTVAQCRDVTSSSANCPTNSEKGWYINLDANEKTTGQATLYNRTVYFPRYIPNKSNPCNPGEANITIHDYKCGNSLSKIKLGAGVASSPVIYKGSIYVGLSGATSSTSSSSGSNTGGSTGGNVGSQLPQGWTIKDNLVVGTPPSGRGSGQITVESWRHVF